MFSQRLPDAEIASDVASSGGGAVIVCDCDHAPQDDVIRNRPPQVSDVHISGIFASSYNGPGKPGIPLTSTKAKRTLQAVLRRADAGEQ